MHLYLISSHLELCFTLKGFSDSKRVFKFSANKPNFFFKSTHKNSQWQSKSSFIKWLQISLTSEGLRNAELKKKK